MSGPTNVGLYGKVASQPDFFRLGAGSFSRAGLDRWLQESVEVLRAERAPWPATPAAFLLAPPGSTAFLGMLAASVDAAGRSFPLALFREIATAEARETLPSLPTVLAGFVSDSTKLLSSGPNFDGQTIARQAEALAVELPALPAPYAWKNEPASGLEAALAGSPPAVAYALRTMLVAGDGKPEVAASARPPPRTRSRSTRRWRDQRRAPSGSKLPAAVSGGTPSLPSSGPPTGCSSRSGLPRPWRSPFLPIRGIEVPAFGPCAAR